MDYVKLRALEISPIDPDTAVNVDGEVKGNAALSCPPSG